MADMLPSKTILINSKVHAHVLKVKAKMTMAPQGDNTPHMAPQEDNTPQSLLSVLTLSESSF